MAEALNIARLFLTDRARSPEGDRVGLRPDGGDLTYADIDALASRVAATLGDREVRPGERVIIALPDGAAYVAALFGVLAGGAVGVMVNPALPPDGLAAMVALAGARVALTTADVPLRVDRPLLLDGEPPFGLPDAPRAEPLATAATDPAIWLFSGGTTGRPKAVVQTHGSFANTTRLYAQRAMAWQPDDVTMSVPKLFFGYATGSNLFFPFSVGASAALFPEHPSAGVIFERVARQRPTILVNVPKMVAEMVAHPDAADADLSSLRFATSAGEALPASLSRRWSDTFGVPLYDGLGTAEMWHIFVSNTPAASRAGSLGRAVPGFEVAVRHDDSTPVPDGSVGRLWVRGDSLGLGYVDDAVATADAFRDGWYVSSDLVRRDDDGFFWYAGRGDDALKVGGKWLLPTEVEDVLIAHPAVAEAAVVGVPDAAGLIKPIAFVVPAPDPPTGLEATLTEWCLARLEPFKHPRRIILTDSLPRTHLGKVDRGALRRVADWEG